METGGITLIKGDLRGIVKARRLSQHTMSNIRQDLFFAFFYNAIGVPLAAGALYPFRPFIESDACRCGDELQFRVSHWKLAQAPNVEIMSAHKWLSNSSRMYGATPMASDSFVDNSLLCGVTHDLVAELFHFVNHKPWQSGIYSKLLVKSNDLRVILIAMEPGAKMKEHHSDRTITIHVLQGLLGLRVEEKCQKLRGGQVLRIAPRVKHDLEALCGWMPEP